MGTQPTVLSFLNVSTSQSEDDESCLTRVLLRCGRSTGPFLHVDQDNHKHIQKGTPGNAVTGSYQFTAADGSEHLVTYIADDKGYRVTGDAKLESGPTTPTEYVRPTQRATTQRPTTQRARTEAPVQKVIQLHRVVQLVQPVQTIQLVQLSQPIQLTQAVPVQSGVQLVQVQPKILSGSFQYPPVSYVQGFQSAETVTNPLLTRYYDYTVDGTQVYLTKRSIKTE